MQILELLAFTLNLQRRSRTNNQKETQMENLIPGDFFLRAKVDRPIPEGAQGPLIAFCKMV
jgi:hypothetical protein